MLLIMLYKGGDQIAREPSVVERLLRSGSGVVREVAYRQHLTESLFAVNRFEHLIKQPSLRVFPGRRDRVLFPQICLKISCV